MTEPARPGLIRLIVDADFAALAMILDPVRMFLNSHGLAGDDIANVLVIIDELVSNIIRHAWADGKDHSFNLELACTQDAMRVVVSLALEDNGIPFDPTVSIPDEAALMSPSRPKGGLGLRVVAALSEEMTYRREGLRNCLTVVSRYMNRLDNGTPLDAGVSKNDP